MPAERYYLPEHFVDGSTVHLEGLEHHHLANVMRGRPGDEVELVNGKGQLAKATIASLEKKHTSLSISNVFEETPPKHSLTLVQGITRLNHLEFIIEKTTELGVTDIQLFPAERSEKKEFSTNQSERIQTILIAAVKQCGRLFIPKVTVIPPIKKWNEQRDGQLLFGDVRPNAPLLVSVLKKHSDITICIGPESGLTDHEVSLLEQKHFVGVKLHTNILRTETAAIAAIAVTSHHLAS